MNDLISRQAAIDFIDAGRLCNPNEPRWSDNEVVNFLKSRPSAGPEIIHCRECKYGVDYCNDGDCYCSNPKWGLKYFGGSWDFYCADAEIGNSGKEPAEEEGAKK